jgi:hypothetical protein
VTWDEWLALASLTGPNAGDGLAMIPTDKAADYAGLLTLAQQPDVARSLIKWARTESSPAIDKSAAFWEDLLKSLGDAPAVASSTTQATPSISTAPAPTDVPAATGNLEAKATSKLTELKKLITSKNWKDAVDTLREIRGKELSSTQYIKGHAQEVTLFEEVLKLSAPALMAQAPAPPPPIETKVTPPVAETTKPEKPAKPITLAAYFKGKVTEMGGGMVKIEYDFKDPAQAEDFEAVGGPHGIKNGELSFASHGVSYHKGHWLSPYKLTVLGKAKAEFRVVVGATGDAKSPAAASNDGWRARVAPPARLVLYREGSEYSDRKTETHDAVKPVALDAILDDKKWSFMVNNVKVLDVNDANMNNPFTHARWGLQRYDEEQPIFVGITIMGRLNPDWLKAALSGNLPPKKDVPKP